MAEHLSENFTREEFACKCGCGYADVDGRLVNALQRLRFRLAKPIHVLSGCRCPSHNRETGGAPASEHLTGRAADITVPGMTAAEVYEEARDILTFRGFGLDSERNMLHLDVRQQYARWGYKGGKTVGWEELEA